MWKVEKIWIIRFGETNKFVGVVIHIAVGIYICIGIIIGIGVGIPAKNPKTEKKTFIFLNEITY